MSNEMTTLGEGAAAYLAKFGGPPQGVFVKFKKGKYVVSQTGDHIPEGTQCVFVYDQTRVGWIKFQGKGNEPVRHMGPAFEDYVPPERDDLDENDKSLWPISDMTGKPQDPWNFQIVLPLQNAEDGTLYLLAVSSLTAIRAANELIRKCQKLYKDKSDQYPMIRLMVGEFKHQKFGEVPVPQFDIVSSANKSDHKAVNLSDDMNDEVPF